MPQIVRGEGNIRFHCEWDNLNRTTSSVHNNTIVNSSGGIMLTNKLSTVQPTGILEKVLELLPGVWWTVNIILLSCRSRFSARCSDARVHSITTRMALQQEYWNQWQAAGSWTEGFIYATGSSPPRKSTVAYFTPIHQPCIVVLSCQPRPWIY